MLVTVRGKMVKELSNVYIIFSVSFCTFSLCKRIYKELAVVPDFLICGHDPLYIFLMFFHKLSYTGNNENLQNLKSLKISLTQCDFFFCLKYLYVMFFFFRCVLQEFVYKILMLAP